MDEEDFEKYKETFKKLLEGLREGMKKLVDLVKQTIAQVNKFIDAAIEDSVDRFIQTHYMLTEHDDLRAIDRYFDDWYPVMQ